MATVNVAITYTAADAAAAQQLRDAYNDGQRASDADWVDISTKDYIGLIMEEAFQAKLLDQWKRNRRDSELTDAGVEDARLKNDITAVVT